MIGDTYAKGKSLEVRNSNGTWINTQVFKEKAEHYNKYGYYISDPFESPAWIEFWDKERDKCIHGVTIGGFKITGDHYFYLNYCPILKAEIGENWEIEAVKVTGFPDFWDGDYNYFWVREIARRGLLRPLIDNAEERKAIFNLDKEEQAKQLKELFESLGLEVIIEPDYLLGGYNLIVGKSRRKGFTYKAAAVAAKNYYTIMDSTTIFGAYDKKYLYPDGIFTYAYANLNFINNNTGWIFPSDVTDKPAAGHVKASYLQRIGGIESEEGFKSQILAVTFQKNADAARGKGARDVFFEEAGAFGSPGLLKKSYKATEDTAVAGKFKTGMITVFGTSGDMKGGTADYADMYWRPKAFGLLPFKNIWEKEQYDLDVGYFHPVNWNMEGFYDNQGNSDVKGAKDFELSVRKQLKKDGMSSTEMQDRLQEKPLGPSEAFAVVSSNTFPVVELKRQINVVRSKNWDNIKGTPVELIYNEDGTVSAHPILDGTAEPIQSYRNLPSNKAGCVVVYESPLGDPPPKGLYKIGYDPVRQAEGGSLAGIIVYKGVHRNSQYHDIIVAVYLGRRESPEDMDRIAEMLAVYYNTKIMHENEVTGVKTYFQRRKKLNLLAAQPNAVISKNIKNSNVARVWGCHLPGPLKEAGIRYIKDWLLTELDVDEQGNVVTVIDRIYSLRLLEELVSFDIKHGNFDLVSALIMALFQVQEEKLGQEYGDEKKKSKWERYKNIIKNKYN